MVFISIILQPFYVIINVRILLVMETLVEIYIIFEYMRDIN